MIRARFTVDVDDYRPVHWPVKHPYWCTGHTDDGAVMVAYADDGKEILSNWPEAKNIEADGATEYLFSDRFPKPYWFKQHKSEGGQSRLLEWVLNEIEDERAMQNTINLEHPNAEVSAWRNHEIRILRFEQIRDLLNHLTKEQR